MATATDTARCAGPRPSCSPTTSRPTRSATSWARYPALPFDDGQFDLVLSSHFLFTYADRLDSEFHQRALVELLRVCRGEVRVFPLLDQGGHALGPMIEELLGRLRRGGTTAEVRPVAYEFQRGGNQMLVLSAH